MKTSKKVFWVRSLVFALLFLLVVPQVSLGYSEDENSSGVVEENEEENAEQGESVSVEGELSIPESPEYNINHTKIVNVLSGPTKVKKHVRYLTGSWAKASSYTWSKSNTASSTLSSTVGITSGSISSSLGVSNSITTTYSTAITIPANSNRFSKLAFYSDFNKRNI
ncbi:hypothetical protein HRF87_27575, partial [Bacillus sp. CRN 9]|nr:hypothetical protein [Bacillus sp. CRN 9]